jgi:hypothetical protein
VHRGSPRGGGKGDRWPARSQQLRLEPQLFPVIVLPGTGPLTITDPLQHVWSVGTHMEGIIPGFAAMSSTDLKQPGELITVEHDPRSAGRFPVVATPLPPETRANSESLRSAPCRPGGPAPECTIRNGVKGVRDTSGANHCSGWLDYGTMVSNWSESLETLVLSDS